MNAPHTNGQKEPWTCAEKRLRTCGRDRLGANLFQKSRGMAQRSLDLIEAMYAVGEAAQPITGRGIGFATMLLDDIERSSRTSLTHTERRCSPTQNQNAKANIHFNGNSSKEIAK
jgi:hypothetical protein